MSKGAVMDQEDDKKINKHLQAVNAELADLYNDLGKDLNQSQRNRLDNVIAIFQTSAMYSLQESIKDCLT